MTNLRLDTRRTKVTRNADVLAVLFALGTQVFAASPAAAEPGVLEAGMRSPVYRNYALACMGCHGPRGDGVTGMIPPLKHSLGWFMHSDAGRKFAIKVPGSSNSSLSDAELADVMNFILQDLNAEILPVDFKPYRTEEIAAIRRPAYSDVRTIRHNVVRHLKGQGLPIPYDY